MVCSSLVSLLLYLLDMCAWVEDLRPRCGLTSGVDDARVGQGGVRVSLGMSTGDEHGEHIKQGRAIHSGGGK
jgi:hypothetical protein